MRLTAIEQLNWKPRCFRCGSYTKEPRHDKPPAPISMYCYMCYKKRRRILARHKQELVAFDEWRNEVKKE